MFKSNAGYVMLYRSILEWEWYDNPNAFRLFIYCILRANFKDGRFEGVNIERGSFVSSLQKLSDATGLTVREVRTALGHLQSTGELTVETMPKFSIIKVNNYDRYQSGDMQSDKQGAGDRQATDRRPPTIGKSKKNNQGTRKTIPFYDLAERTGTDYDKLQTQLILRDFQAEEGNANEEGKEAYHGTDN